MKPGTCTICETHTNFLLKKAGYRLTKCPTCKLIALDPQPTQETLSTLYSGDNGYHTHLSQEFIDDQTREFVKRIEKSEEILSTSNLSVLDIGAAHGLFLDEAKKRGWTTEGIEMNPATAQLCRDHGHTMVTGSFDDFVPSRSYDVIHMGDVIEHMLDPRLSVKRSHAMLSEKGLVIVATPNADGLFQRISLSIAKATKLDWPHALPPAHTFQFSRKNLDELFAQEGFVNVATTYLDTSFMEEMRDTEYFQTIYQYLKRKKGATSQFLLHAALFGLASVIYLPLWLISDIAYSLGHEGSHMTLWYQKISR